MKHLIKGRKGQNAGVETVPQDTLYFAVISVLWAVSILLIFTYTLRYKSIENSIPSSLQEEAITLRFLEAGSCLTHEEGGRVYAGVMEWSKFNDADRLNSCYNLNGNDGSAFRLKLQRENGDSERSVQTPNWDNSRASVRETKYPVLVWDGKPERGLLTISVQQKQ